MKLAQNTPQPTQPVQPTELTNLRNSIVKFHQNMKIAFDKMKTAAVIKGAETSQAVYAIYKGYFENVAAAPVFGAKFTTDQVTQHLHYLEGITKKLGSENVVADTSVVQIYGKQPYYISLKGFGQRVRDNFVPLATALNGTDTLPSDQLITKAPTIGQILDRVGANFVTQLQSYLTEIKAGQFQIRPPIRGKRMDELVKMATEFEMIVNGGLMKVDENDFQTVFNWARRQFCCNVKKHIKQNLEKILESTYADQLKEWIVSFNLILNRLSKYNENDIEQTTSFKLNDLTDPLFVSWVIENPHNIGYSGIFIPEENTIELVFDIENVEDIDSFNKEFMNVKSTLKHELQHAIQFDYKHYSEKEVGYPSDKIRNFNPPGTSLLSHKSIDYYQRDEEFYPILETDVKLFNREYQNIPEAIKQMAIKVWVGEVRPPIDNMYRLRPSNFFTSLKKQPDIWKKAVKEFYKAVN